MENLEKKIAQSLLQIKAIKLEPANYFTWASGWKSPIYCDNRKTLSYPEIRKIVKEGFVEIILSKYGKPDAIAGVATGAIAIGALVAEALELPFVYVRPKPKEHGLGNMIEGEIKTGSKVVVIEDLISTGKSSLQAVEALRNAQIEVIGMVAIFTYEFDHAAQNFLKDNVTLHTLSNYHVLIETALETGYIKQSDIETLKQWRTNPETWNQ
ncbi:MAG: orotate phosphoribosyltransferase [Bacteroidetes bacterium GWF2_33_16]|nr:MAG: orotate phosphoribosyltransferase [Bacteroidetes bacterium GWE2_32_14]OFY05231.1 MAG: orotate phosphoribosyltransferase [Bacteroidetes bacterium GWF2_33_16]